jgi:leucyl aminopeptidase
MTPLRFAEYVENAFAGTNVEVQVIREVSTIESEYPLLGAVARSSKEVPKHHPTVIKLNYRSPKPEDVKENLFFVGKGVCFDTGGADLKVGGAMRGMSSDKCGAASVAGFLLTVAHLKPTSLNITASCAMVINSIGPNAYLCDEIITSRAGKRVLIANTDAEGRMAMTDLLAEAKELALEQKAKNPEQPVQLFTVATLTGHAVLAVGPYSIALDNGPARKRKISQRIFDAGLEWGDIFEVSTLRREDFQVIAPGSDAEDVVQSGTAPSSRTTRGHQFPAAFMITASGLDKHGLNASQNEQIPYTHLDIAGGSTDHARGWGIERANGRPLASLVGAFVL